MREITAVICDDEPLARRGIRQLLTRHPDVRVVAEARNGREALAALEARAPDLIFLDVQMPELGGFDVVRERGPEHMPAVVFVTAYDEYAVNAFDVHALDYLVKPIVEARFDTAMARLRQRLRTADALSLSRQLADLLAAESLGPAAAAGYADRMAVSTASGILMLDVADIDWIGAENYYAAVYVGSRRHLVREALTSLELRLDPDRFVRVHRSALVNLDRIRELRSGSDGGAAVVLRNGVTVPLSRRRRDMVAARLRHG